MKKAVACLRLIRPWHWIKNLLIFLPAFFGGALTQSGTPLRLIAGFFCFSFAASGIYVVNDLCDAEKDAANPEKCHRPIASGEVGKPLAVVLAAVLFAAAAAVAVLLGWGTLSPFLPLAYTAVNFLYSFWLKHVPVWDIAALVSGFFLRVFYGSVIADVPISGWLYLAVISVAAFLAFGKRRGEKLASPDGATRPVLKKYSLEYLTFNLYLYLALFLVCYAVWSIEAAEAPYAAATTPLVFIIMTRYTYLLDRGSSGDPVGTLLHDKTLLLLGALYAAAMAVLVYFPGLLG